MKDIELRIPNLGEAEDTEIIEISVKKGDKLSKNDPIIVLESEKAAMEVPSDFNGVIKDIKVKEGDSVKEGTVFAVIEVEEVEETKETKEKIKTLPQEKIEQDVLQKIEKTSTDFSGINAGPAVRKIARELELDLKKIIGSGKNRLITKDDLKLYVQSLKEVSSTKYNNVEELKRFGDFYIENQTKVKVAASKNLFNSWSNIPHVTHFEVADMTSLEIERKAINKIAKTKISVLSYFVRAVALNLKKFPIFNSSIIDEGKIMMRNYINIGIAVNTDYGLLVPVIKNADKLNIGQISENIKMLSDKARNKRILEKDLEASTFTISSLGNIGGTGFTPIINPPEVAILGLSKGRSELEKNDNEIIERIKIPFSLSYDHRVINGVDAGLFMDSLRDMIENYIE